MPSIQAEEGGGAPGVVSPDEETPARLYWNPEDPNSQTCYASLNFIGP